ncbi:SH3 domain-containing protein [Intestinimonas timonensis]|uniref:SH3 domain-containing protein n=1 Tax=Intestinimonas timonensis TaxID=1689270 RepID=UPI001031DF55|nr:SH3 domain-containing protein [Intestinimonas timonensis]
MKRARILIVSLAAACLLVLSACGPKELPQDSTTSTGTSSISGNTKEDSGEKPVQQDTVDKTETTPATPEQTIEDLSDIQKEPVETSAPTEQEQLFTDCNETMYATTTVNVRSSYSTNSDKLGSLAKAQSVKCTGIGTGAAAGWSRIEFNGKVAYVSSDYLSTTKPQVNTSTGSSGSSSGQTSKPSSKPSTGGNSGSSGGQTSKSSTGGNTSSGGSSSGGSSSGGLGDLANQIQQDRDDMGYSGADAGGYLTDEDYDWISGNVQLD